MSTPAKVTPEQNPDVVGITWVFHQVIAVIDMIFPGRWLQKWFPKNRIKVVDSYTIGKAILPVLLLAFSLYHCNWFIFLTIYLTLETINYNFFHIFRAKEFTHKKSMTRNILLGMFNYLELVFNFAFFYAASGRLHRTTSFDAAKVISFGDYIYFSMVTGATVGYGDIVAAGDLGHLIVICQIFIFIVFLAIFITYNLSLFINKSN